VAWRSNLRWIVSIIIIQSHLMTYPSMQATMMEWEAIAIFLKCRVRPRESHLFQDLSFQQSSRLLSRSCLMTIILNLMRMAYSKKIVSRHSNSNLGDSKSRKSRNIQPLLKKEDFEWRLRSFNRESNRFRRY
jgi:hypothetical protein